ncbi:MAG: hypothetical protein HC911_06645 [Chloroflexaceae bacterium]|nr:hypothetical protein [Chloroflexaceae bacterium]
MAIAPCCRSCALWNNPILCQTGPPLVSEADWVSVPQGFRPTPTATFGDINIFRAEPGREYAAVIVSDGERTPCVAAELRYTAWDFHIGVLLGGLGVAGYVLMAGQPPDLLARLASAAPSAPPPEA